MSDGRRRCCRCKYIYHDFSGRWINRGDLFCTQWLRLIALFVSEVPTLKMTSELGFCYNTTYKAVSTIREAIVAHAEDAAELMTWQYQPDASGAGTKNGPSTGEASRVRIPVFGLCGGNGKVSVTLLPAVRPEALFDLSLKKARMGSLVFTDRFMAYDALLFFGYPQLNLYSRHFRRGRVQIDGLNSGFLDYARSRLMKHHGVSYTRFPLYLKEFEFRYNNRDRDIFQILLKYLCDFMPNHE